MGRYLLKNYQKGFEADQARVGIEVAKNWVWPFAYDEENLLKAAAQADFDPETRYYCFHRDEMVGYMFALITGSADEQALAATLEFPRMVHGHKKAALPLLEWALEALARKEVTRITGGVSTTCPGDIRVADDLGFSIQEWG